MDTEQNEKTKKNLLLKEQEESRFFELLASREEINKAELKETKAHEEDKSTKTIQSPRPYAKKTIEYNPDVLSRVAIQTEKTLSLLGFDTASEGLKDTPKRYAQAMMEILSPQEFDFTVFPAGGYDELIVEKRIPFQTFCEHHLLPFYGTVVVGYLPDDKIVGLSKLVRAVHFFAATLNTQEYMTQNIANFISERLNAKGVGVLVQGVHMCQVMRGAKTPGEMVTSALVGEMKNELLKNEFLKIALSKTEAF